MYRIDSYCFMPELFSSDELREIEDAFYSMPGVPNWKIIDVISDEFNHRRVGLHTDVIDYTKELRV